MNTTNTTTPTETLAKYISDMIGAEHHLAHTLAAQEGDHDLKDFPEARQLISKYRALSERRLAGLENLGNAHQAARSSVKEALTALTGGTVGALSHFRSHNVSKMLRDDYVTMSLNAVAYSMLHTTGLALGAADVAQVALAHLQEVASHIIELSQSIVPVVVAELGKTEPVNIMAQSVASQNIRDAWRNA